MASADGVGTKLRVAFMTGVHTTIGVDLVNHCVNDILVQGAQPLFFLDYLATGRLDPDVAVQIVQGLAAACRDNGCALLGGETAEMPGFYADGEYDVAGFIVGVVARDALIDGKGIVAGDVLIGLPSSGLHTNGYSLARRIAFEQAGLAPGDRVGELGDVDRRGAPRTASILSADRPAAAGRAPDQGHGAHHRRRHHRQPAADSAERHRAPSSIARAWQVPALFQWLQKTGGVPDADMLRTFNMGIGLIVACAERDAARLLTLLASAGEPGAVRIGRIEPGAGVSYV